MADAEPDQGTARAPGSDGWRAPRGAPPGASLAARVASNWHWLVLGGWTLAWFAILAPGGGIAWKFFTEGSRLLFGPSLGRLPRGGGLHLYASHPQLQIGPVSFAVAQVLRPLGPDQGLVAAQVALTAVGLVLAPAIAGIATKVRPELTARPEALRWTVLAGGAVFLIAWVELSVAYTHLDDGLALALAVLAVRAAATGQPHRSRITVNSSAVVSSMVVDTAVP